jgi:hypothetical protein
MDNVILKCEKHPKYWQQELLFEPQEPYNCQFCGAPSWLHPSDQTMPPDYCHESDHGSRSDDEG